MTELIDKKKLIADLKAIKDMLVAAGDPFLASVINRSIGCVENQPVVLFGADLVVVGRCKDCAYKGHFVLEPYVCMFCASPPDDGYCAWFKPKEGQ